MKKSSTKTITTIETVKTKVTHEAITVNYGTEPDFIKLYLGTVMYLADMPTGIAGVLACIIRRIPYMDEEDQSVYLPGEAKRMIAQKLGKSEQYVSDSITALVKGKILFRLGTRHSTRYLVNPHIFGRGHWKDIKELQLHVNFNANGTSFWSEVLLSDVPEKMRGVLADTISISEIKKKKKEQNENRRQKEYEELKTQIRQELEAERNAKNQ